MADKVKYQDLTPEDLKNRLSSASEELVQARQKHRLGQFKKTSELGRLKKEIARVKTYLNLKTQKAAS